MSLSMTAALAALGGAAAVFGVSLYMQNRPYVPGRVWRMPWTAIMFAAMVVMAWMLAQAAAILKAG